MHTWGCFEKDENSCAKICFLCFECKWGDNHQLSKIDQCMPWVLLMFIKNYGVLGPLSQFLQPYHPTYIKRGSCISNQNRGCMDFCQIIPSHFWKFSSSDS
jgi:hypothetical protein